MQPSNGVRLGFRADVVQQAEVCFEKFVDALEEPAMRVDLSLVTLFNRKEKVHPPLVQILLLQPEVPRRHLENVQQVLGQVFRWNAVVHNVVHGLHLVVAISILFHEASAHELLLIKEALVSRELLEALRDVVVAIADEEDAEVVLRELGLRVHAHSVVVVDDATESSFQLALVLVVHRDARSDFGVHLTQCAAGSNLREETSSLYLSERAVTAEASWADFFVILGVRESNRLERYVLCRLPILQYLRFN